MNQHQVIAVSAGIQVQTAHPELVDFQGLVEAVYQDFQVTVALKALKAIQGLAVTPV